MRRGTLLLSVLGGILLLVGAKDSVQLEKAVRHSVLEGDYRYQADHVFKHWLATESGQLCVLRESEKWHGEGRLGDLEPGARIHVEGVLDSLFYPEKPADSAIDKYHSWFIFMDVLHLQQIHPAPTEIIPAQPLEPQ
ncbi:hypothetical protein ACFL6U_24715 [Planctomycetota bacterium]